MESLELPVTLGGAELLAKGKELTTALSERDRIDSEKAEVTAAIKTRAAELDTKVRRLRLEIATGEEMRRVEVEQRRLPGTRILQTIRLDTGAVVASRLMTDAELQEPLPLGPRILDAEEKGAR